MKENSWIVAHDQIYRQPFYPDITAKVVENIFGDFMIIIKRIFCNFFSCKILKRKELVKKK